MILYTEGDTRLETADSEYVMSILCATYPGHPWATLVRGGVVFIKHLEMGNNWGMVRKFNDIKHDATTFKREIVMAAGEFLERAGLVRGRANGDEIVRVEGVPEKYQPEARKIPIEAESIVVAASDGPLRDIPRPQAVRGNDE